MVVISTSDCSIFVPHHVWWYKKKQKTWKPNIHRTVTKPWQHCDYSSLLVQLTHTSECWLNSKPTVFSIQGCLKPSQLITLAVTLRTCHCECGLRMGENTPTLKPSQKPLHLSIIFSGWFRLCARSEPTSARTDIFSRLIAVIWRYRRSNSIILAVAN